jgi:hypothetical protein
MADIRERIFALRRELLAAALEGIDAPQNRRHRNQVLREEAAK